MIDTDSLELYHKEIIETPSDFTKRELKKLTALRRLKTMIKDLFSLPKRASALRFSPHWIHLICLHLAH